MDRAVPYALVGLLALGLVVALGFVAARGLGELGGGDGPYVTGDEWAEPVGADPAIVYVEPATVAASPPAPVSFELPTCRLAVRDFHDRPNPTARVRALLSMGDVATRRDVLRAIAAARDDGTPAPELSPVFDGMLLGHPTPTHCAWLREVIRTGGAPDDAAWSALLWCDDGATDRFVEEASPPDWALVTWLGAHPWRARAAPVERIEQAEESLRRRGAEAYADQARVLLERLRSETAAPTPDALVREPTTSLRVLAARWPGEPDALARALVRCAVADPREPDGPGEWRSAECLSELHGLSEPMAVHAARAVQRRAPELGYLRETAKALADGAVGDALVPRLEQHGLTWPGDSTDPGAPHAAAPRDFLQARGRALCFDPQPGSFPVGHDGLAMRLAFLARPALDDVAFVEEQPWEAGYDYSVHAYAGGLRYSAAARNQGGRLDTHAVVGLLNALLRERYSGMRLAWLAVPGWELECVVAGSEHGLLAAEREGLITLMER